jgi:DNA polymerase-3 subunit beta
MKIVCEHDDLQKALNIALKGVSYRTTLPILSGILLTAEDGKLIISSTDMSISIKTSAPAIIHEEGKIVISAKVFSEIVRKLSPGSVKIEDDENSSVEIENGTFSTTLQGISPDEYPEFEKIDAEDEIVKNKDMLVDMIKGTAFAASIEEARGIITGVLIEIQKEEMTMVALDGFRMAIKREQIVSGEEKNIIIPGKIVNEIGKILAESEEDEEVTIKVGERKAYFILKNTSVEVRLLDGEYIKYRDIIPAEGKVKSQVNRKALLDTIERASIVAREGKNVFVRFSITDNELTVSTRADEGKTIETIPHKKTGDDLEIGFNARFVADTIKAIPDEEIVMEFNTSISPCLIKPIEGNSYEYLILPVRLSSVNI